MSGFVSALRYQSHPQEDQLAELRKLITRLDEILDRLEPARRHYLERIQDGKNDDEIRAEMADMAYGIKLFKEAIRLGHSRDDAVRAVWSDRFQGRLESVLEFLEDYQETLAIGLSPAFAQQIKEAREEAGIARSAKPDVPSE